MYLYVARPATYHVHINTVGIGPGMLEELLKTLTKDIGDLVEPDELLDLLHLGMVPSGTGIQALNDGTHVTKYTRIHKG